VHLVCYVALGEGYSRSASISSRFFTPYLVDESLVRNLGNKEAVNTELVVGN
jgi:hypothetical protein